MMEDWEKAEKMRQTMELITDNAINKAIARSTKEGNTWLPWSDFSEEHLEMRLRQEIDEYFEDKRARELTDIINVCVFLFLRKTIYRIEEEEP